MKNENQKIMMIDKDKQITCVNGDTFPLSCKTCKHFVKKKCDIAGCPEAEAIQGEVNAMIMMGYVKKK